VKAILALGNPGARYQETRHNIGWLVADAVIARLHTRFLPGKGEFYVASANWKGEEVVIVKPTTYMNNSGLAARQVVDRFSVDPASMLVLVDEVQFPVGRIQVRSSGSDGGHNGLRSIIDCLDTDRFPRLRCGIDRNFAPGGMADYVLSPFSPDEIDARNAMIALACEATLCWVVEGTEATMLRFNTRSSPVDGE